jgi:phage terminase large subunit GpA-like protein
VLRLKIGPNLFRKWERTPGRRAESLDCVIYAMAVRALINASVERRAEEVGAVTMPKPCAIVAKSKWLEGR